MLGGEPVSFGSEHEHVVDSEPHVVEALLGVRREPEASSRAELIDERFEIAVHGDRCELVVVQSGTSEGRSVETESERLDEMEPGAGVGAQTDDIAGVRPDLRCDEHHVDRPAAGQERSSASRLRRTLPASSRTGSSTNS